MDSACDMSHACLRPLHPSRSGLGQGWVHRYVAECCSSPIMYVHMYTNTPDQPHLNNLESFVFLVRGMQYVGTHTACALYDFSMLSRGMHSNEHPASTRDG